MADSPVPLRDGGISDILTEGENKRSEQVTPKMTENGIKETGPVNTQNGSSEEHNETHAEGGQGAKVSSTDVSNVSKTSPRSYTGELDLTDPESVIQMLENVDLTEEDTEDLLQEAYNMNRKLKEMLRRQEMESGTSKPKLKSRSKSNVESHLFNGQGSSSSTASSSSTNSRNGSSFGIRKVLPPINHGERETSVYAIKLRRSKTNVPDMKSTAVESSVLRTRSSKPAVRKDSESPTRRRKASGPRPEWNDRFNFS